MSPPSFFRAFRSASKIAVPDRAGGGTFLGARSECRGAVAREGPAANAAFLLSSWGVSTAFAVCLEEDREAEAILAEFRRAGTGTGLVLQAAECGTPFATILVNRRRGTRIVLTRHLDRPDWSRLSGRRTFPRRARHPGRGLPARGNEGSPPALRFRPLLGSVRRGLHRARQWQALLRVGEGEERGRKQSLLASVERDRAARRSGRADADPGG